MDGDTVRIAAWSGPRNISTALMRSFEARGDTVVVDEPLYAFYLARTGREHPGREAVLASQPDAWESVRDALTAPIPGAPRLQYQKHMAQHLLPEVPLDWSRGFRHFLLVREPERVLASFAKVVERPCLEDTGFPQQVRLLEDLGRLTGRPPPVVLANDVLRDPPGHLARLCAALELPYTDAMLSWPAGPRSTDGVWAPHWYAAVEASTGFGPPREEPVVLPPELESIREKCTPLYERLLAHRL